VKRLTTAVVATAIVLSACSTSITSPPANSASTQEPSIATTSSTAAPAHTPHWLTIKYRTDPVDVADPRFAYLGGGSSSLVDFAFYDAGNEYMIVSLNGTAYHYCGTPGGAWGEFTAASSLGSFYEGRVKGRFDCRTGFVPQY
jgi:hypothetical protein